MNIVGVSTASRTFLSDRLLISPQEKRELKRTDRIFGRIALKLALSARSPAKIGRPDFGCIRYSSTGQPLIADSETLHCSVSHSGYWALGAVADFPIGIDIEQIKPRKNTNVLLDYISPTRERGGETERGSSLLTKLWTIKEAVVKGLGKGWSIPPCKVEIISRSGNVYLVTVNLPDTPNPNWRVTLTRKKGYFVSIATPSDFSHETPCIHWY